MVNEELSVVHAIEDLHMHIGADSQQMSDLRFGNKRLFRSVPKVNICAMNGVQTIGINRLIAVFYRPGAA